jgi:hypothetical protein
MPHVAAECGSDKPISAIGIVVETHFQGNQPFFAQVYILNDLMLRPIPEVKLTAVFPCATSSTLNPLVKV